MKNTIVLIFCLIAYLAKAQSFEKGEITINGNVGGPLIPVAAAKTGLKLYYTSTNDRKFEVDITNTPALNSRIEYGISEEVSLGLSVAYWKINALVKETYSLNVNNIATAQLDEINLGVSALAIGVRGNYHFNTSNKESKIDPYIGGAIGFTNYDFSIGFTSSVEGKSLPQETFKFKAGGGPYFATTFGLRYYPIKYIGLNTEIGWDRGALFFAGIIFKIPTIKH